MMRLPFAAGDYPADEVDPDYLYFLRHIRPDGDSYTLELPSDGVSPHSVIRYEAPADHSGGGGATDEGECVSDPSAGRSSTNRPPTAEEKESSVEVDAGADPSSWIDSLVDVDEDYRIFLKHTRVVNGNLVLEMDGVVVNYPCAMCSESGSEVEDAREKGEKEVAMDEGDEPVVIVPDPKVCDWVAEGEEEEGLLTSSAPRTQGTKGTKKMKASSSNGNGAGTSVPPGLQGVIWPTYINNRPDSDFKRRLLDVLNKPFSRKEYIKLFDMASIRTPLVKLRQVRNDAKFYPTEEMGNSYFDHYPDLVEQVLHTSYPNGLALMRGFFFWLQNSAHEDQFWPWVDVSKDHEVIHLVD